MNTHTVQSAFYDDGKVTAFYIGNQGRPVGESICEECKTCDMWFDTFATKQEAEKHRKEVLKA